MSASSFIVNLQWYLLSLPPSLPPTHPPSPTLALHISPRPPSTHFPYHPAILPRHTSIHPFHLTPSRPPFTLHSHPFRRIPARPKIPPPSVGSATNYCIGNRLDYQSFDNASSSAASAPLAVSERVRSLARVRARALSTHPPSYPLVTIPLCSVPWQIICSDEA